MRRTRLPLFAASVVLILGPALAAGAGQAVVASAWTAQPVTVDGLRNEWQGTALTDWKKDAVAFAFRNDGETLYVLLVIQDPQFRSSIEGTGVTLYFDARGAKAKDYGILFKKMRLGPAEYIAYLEKRGPVSSDDRAKIQQKAGFFLFHHQVLDRKGKPVEASGEALSVPAVFKYAPEGKAQVYEFSVPLLRASDLVAGVGSEPGGTLSVGFAWGGETEEIRKAAAKRLREQANFTNEESDRGGGKPIVGPVSSGPAPKKCQFWTGLKLAANPN
jgi:hypothetical protein